MITLKNVAKIFKEGAGTHEVLRDVSYSFQKGFRYLITGPSGSGKSTLLLLIAGIEQPTQGTVMWEEEELALQTQLRHEAFLCESIGIVFQSAQLIPECSVLENCMIKGLALGMPKRLCIERGMELLDLVGLATFAQGKPLRLSGGEQQRLALARALFLRPQFLLADEPIAHLDEQSARNILELLAFFHQNYGMGMIVSSHDPAMLAGVDEVVSVTNKTLIKVDKKAFGR